MIANGIDVISNRFSDLASEMASFLTTSVATFQLNNLQALILIPALTLLMFHSVAAGAGMWVRGTQR